jgi:pimeloyl-ACP methyl ester carboxylesterase
MNPTTTLTAPEPAPAPTATPTEASGTPRGHVGRIVTATILGGLVASIIAVTGPFAGAEEHVVTGVVLVTFAASWGLLAHLTTRRTDQPQAWAKVPAAAMAIAALFVLVVAPTGNEAGWIWPLTTLALVAWMVVRSRRDLRSRTRLFLLYPVFAALVLSALGGAYETYRESLGPAALAMPGRLVDVGDHQLHISCTGTGTPTVVLEAGLGEISAVMSARIAPDVAGITRVCVYDRAGRGWSESAHGLQDGEAVATDLHTLLDRAGESGPYVLAGHSAGGIYVLNFARLFAADTAGVVLLDSMHPEQYERMPSWPAFYEMFRRASAVMPSLARFGVSRLINSASYGDLPEPQRTQERELLSTPAHNRSVRDELDQIRVAMAQAAELDSLADLPLVVVTAQRGQEAAWFPMQTDLLGLSTNSTQVEVADASHQTLLTNEDTAAEASDAIADVVSSVRQSSTLTDAIGARGRSTTGATIDRPTGDRDELVDIDGGRMHLRCVGRGRTTVLLLAGWGAAGDAWGVIERASAERARVCSYSRFGTGTSDPQVATQTFTTQAADLDALLTEAGEPGPYVIVGHSFGGAEAVTFATTHPDEVVGLLLLDASPTDWPAHVCTVVAWAAGCEIMRDPTRDPERLDVFAAFDEVAAITSLDDLPMVVVTAAHRRDPGPSPTEYERLDAAWADGMERWAALSSASTIVTIEDTGHDIHVDQPQLVIDELLKLIP